MVMQRQPIGYTEGGTNVIGSDGTPFGGAANPAVAAPGTIASGLDPLASSAGIDPNTGLAPMTGFASRYTPAMADQAYENPWYVLPDVFPGMKTSSPMYQALRDPGGDLLTLFNILAGSGQKIDQGAGTFINWLENIYKQQATPGGKDFDAAGMISTLFGQDKMGAESDNTLGQILGAGDMGTQVRTLFNMLREVSNVGMNPLAARGYQSAVAQAGDMYGNAQMKADATEDGGASMSPNAWIAKNLPWLAGR